MNETMQPPKNSKGYACIGLNNAKSEVNVGAVLRAAGIYRAAFVATTGNRAGRCLTDTMGSYQYIPLLRPETLRAVVPFDCVPVAVDLLDGAQSLVMYAHPKRAFYIFGAEDNTLGKKITSWCRDVIYVPTNGCMNLAAAVNVVLYDRMSKEMRSNREKVGSDG